MAERVVEDDEPVPPGLTIYVVRDVETKRLVGVFIVSSLDAMTRLLDEAEDVHNCEYATIPELGLYWAGEDGPPVPFRDDAPGGPVLFTDQSFDSIDQIKRWTPTGEGYVYFIRAGDMVKIGRSKDTRNRMMRLQTGSGTKLELLLELPGGADDETHYHLRFRKHYSHGEWFRYEGELRDFLEGSDG